MQGPGFGEARDYYAARGIGEGDGQVLSRYQRRDMATAGRVKV